MSKRRKLSDLGDVVESIFDRLGDKDAAEAIRRLRASPRLNKLVDVIADMKRGGDGKLRFYVASRLENAANVDRLADTLIARHDWKLTYRWTDHGSVQKDGPDRIREVSVKEYRGIEQADLVIVLLPGGRGTHVELGIALGMKKHVLIWGESEAAFADAEGRECAFYRHPYVRRVTGPFDDLAKEMPKLVGAEVEAEERA